MMLCWCGNLTWVAGLSKYNDDLCLENVCCDERSGEFDTDGFHRIYGWSQGTEWCFPFIIIKHPEKETRNIRKPQTIWGDGRHKNSVNLLSNNFEQ